jgi:hypothetical protein
VASSSRLRGRTTRAHHTDEDVTSQAGWLFADSFLALMVVFLATISFVPALGGGFKGNATINVGSLAGKNISNGLIFAYDSFDAARIKKDFTEVLSSQKLAPTTKVLYVKIVGGFNATNESPDQGTVRALAFSVQLQKAGLPAFAEARIDLGNSKLIGKNQVVMRITLTA